MFLFSAFYRMYFILFQVNKVEGIFADGYVSGFMFIR